MHKFIKNFVSRLSMDNIPDRKECCLSKSPPNYYLRPMVNDDVKQVLEIWRLNNLHEGTHTIQSFLNVDPEGIVVAVDCDNDRILGMCSGVFVNPDTAFIGLYGVLPDYQKMGIGIAMWRQTMARIGDRNAGLNAVPEQKSTYRDKAGFRYRDSKQLFIYDSDSVRTNDLVKSIGNVRTRKINPTILAEVIDYDRQIHGYSRAKLVPSVVAEPDTMALAAIDEYDNKIVGYGCFRTNNVDKAMAGPLYADNDAVAELIIYEIIKAFPIVEEKGLLYMTLDSNAGGIRIAEKLGLEKHEEIDRYFLRKVYEGGDWKRVYCIHSPNFSMF